MTAASGPPSSFRITSARNYDADGAGRGHTLYNTLIGLERFEEAFEVFRDRLDRATL